MPKESAPMTASEVSRFKIRPDDRKRDDSLKEKEGWHRMDVRWLITGETMGSTMTVVGRTTMPPGVKAQHAWHRHPNAEEWELVLQGVGIKHVGPESFFLRPGELAFVPRNVYHGLENASDTETLVTVWGYCGASSLEQAGYVIPADDPAAPDYVRGD
jgi:quercetin dioxygenase-like cupin family protein